MCKPSDQQKMMSIGDIMKVKSNYDYSLSLIRFIATAFIVTCHITWYLDNELAWWFNVGVQIFLCMSGFLYGNRAKISDDLTFLKNNIIKILVDYYVVVISVMLLFAVFAPEEVSLTTAVKVLLTYGTLNGGGHLWYISYCLLCYFITPFLFRCFESSKHIVIAFSVIGILAVVITEAFVDYFNAAWIFCYILGFFLGHILHRKKDKLFRAASFLIVAAAVILNTVQILQNYVLKSELTGIVALLYGRFCDYAHVFLGVSLFIILRAAFLRVFKKGYPDFIQKLCRCSDKYSYDVYLVHQFVIFGPFSLMKCTGILAVNVVLVIVTIVACAVVVNFVSGLIKNRIKVAGKK